MNRRSSRTHARKCERNLADVREFPLTDAMIKQGYVINQLQDKVSVLMLNDVEISPRLYPELLQAWLRGYIQGRVAEKNKMESI